MSSLAMGRSGQFGLGHETTAKKRMRVIEWHAGISGLATSIQRNRALVRREGVFDRTVYGLLSYVVTIAKMPLDLRLQETTLTV